MEHSLLANGIAFAACFAFGFLVSGRRAVLGITTRGALCMLVAAALAYAVGSTPAIRELGTWGAILSAILFAVYATLDVLAYTRGGLERS